MGLFENLFGGKVKRMVAKNDFNGIVSVMLTDTNPSIAREAGGVFRKMVWNTLCVGAGWEGLFMLGIDIAEKVIANPPLDDERAEYAYLVYDQGFGSGSTPHDFEFEGRPLLKQMLEGVQQALLKLYLNGGDYFHDKLSDNALEEGSNRLHPLYLQKLYTQLLQEGKKRSRSTDYYWKNKPDALLLIPKELYEN